MVSMDYRAHFLMSAHHGKEYKKIYLTSAQRSSTTLARGLSGMILWMETNLRERIFQHWTYRYAQAGTRDEHRKTTHLTVSSHSMTMISSKS